MAMNSANIFGRLARDPEKRVTTTGKSVTSFTVAVDRNKVNPDGTRDADFIDCVAWENTADFLGGYGKKGMQCAVSGRIQKRSYESSDGRTVWVTEIVASDVNLVFPPKESEGTRVEGTYSEVRYGTPHQPHQSSRVGAAGRDIDLYSDSAVNPDDLPF